MNNEQLEDLMYRAGLTEQGCWDSMDQYDREAIMDFAKLVAAAEREKVAAWMHFNDYTTGHGDTIEDLLEEIQAQVAESERWKSAQVAEAYEPTCDVCPKGVAAAIRARGET